jgi:hypothetical protein
MSRTKGALYFLLLAVIFLAWNHEAYRGYFQTDEIDNVSWTPYTHLADYLKTAVSPQFQANNFRPVGHFFFREASLAFGLAFWKYVAVIHAFHLLNAWLIWLIARRLGSPPIPAGAACFLFAIHMTLFDAVWKPMYAFDVFCATFCLLSLISYIERRWILSFVCYWAAYRSKELAVMLPLVFAAYEIWFGQSRRKPNWKPLAAFFLASLSFGIQGILYNPNKNNDYTFRFSAAALLTTLSFYGSKIFLVPYAGWLLPIAAALSKNRRAWFGVATTVFFFAPLLFLPGRLFSAYCYVPFTGLAIAFSGFAEAFGVIPLAAFFLIFLPLNYRSFAAQRATTLPQDGDAKTWITTAARFAATRPAIDTVVFAASPIGFGRSGCEGALRYAFHDHNFHIVYTDDAEARTLLHREKVAFLTWDYDTRRLYIQSHTPNLPDAAYLDLRYSARVWQLETGWYDQEGDHRWTAAVATARLTRPDGARKFQLSVDLFGAQFDANGPVTVHVSLNGQPLPPHTFSKSWWNSAEWDLAAAPAGPVLVEIRSEPLYRAPDPPNPRGLAVGGFGFASELPK